jgi:aryl-alcohol dehydrogenase-like predicted oxidoreductase
MMTKVIVLNDYSRKLTELDARACEASLARLGTEHLDLYLAHWRDRGADLSVIVTAFENLRTAGKSLSGAGSGFGWAQHSGGGGVKSPQLSLA